MRILERTPDRLPDADPPRVRRSAVNGTRLHVEVRGTGRPLLLVPAGGEDAEWWRAVAERLPGRTVVTYDRRGTGRSGREDWPGKGSAQHADDAAAMLVDLGLREVVVFGNSSAGVVTLQLAIRHPGLIRRALVFEPGHLRQVPAGEELHGRMHDAVAEHLAARPGDWAGAAAAVGRALIPSPAPPPGSAGLFSVPAGKEWYMIRGTANAESLIRDDVPILSYELADEVKVADCPVDIRFAVGSETARIFRDVTARLAALRGTNPEVIEGVGHAIHLEPDVAARHIEAASA